MIANLLAVGCLMALANQVPEPQAGGAAADHPSMGGARTGSRG
jgi:hypothetical protein